MEPRVIALLVVGTVVSLVFLWHILFRRSVVRARYLRLVEAGGSILTVQYLSAINRETQMAHAVKGGSFQGTAFDISQSKVDGWDVPEPTNLSGNVYSHQWGDWRRVIRDDSN